MTNMACASHSGFHRQQNGRWSAIADPALLFSTPLVVGLLWVAVLWIRHLDVFGTWPPVSDLTMAYIAAWSAILVAAIVAGIALMKRRMGALARPAAEPYFHPDAYVYAASAMAVLGAIMLATEFVVVRGYPLFGSVTELRILEVNRAMSGFAGSWLGGSGRALIACTLVGWCVVGRYWHRISPAASITLVLATLFVVFCQSRFEGGRFFLATICIVAVVSYGYGFITRYRIEGRGLPLKSLRHLSPTYVLQTVALLIVVQFYTSAVFVDRIDKKQSIDTALTGYVDGLQLSRAKPAAAAQRTADAPQSNASSAKPATPGPGAGAAVTAAAATSSPPPASLATPARVASIRPETTVDQFKLTMLWLYVTQGPNELDRVMNFEGLRHGWGTYQFHQLGLLMSKLTGRVNHFDHFKGLPTWGTYLTMAGASYVDFGIAGGLAFSAAFGLLLGAAVYAGIRGGSPWLALSAPLLLTLAVFSPIASIIPTIWPALAWIVVFSVLDLLARESRLRAQC